MAASGAVVVTSAQIATILYLPLRGQKMTNSNYYLSKNCVLNAVFREELRLVTQFFAGNFLTKNCVLNAVSREELRLGEKF